ncbi:cysteine proteinase [Amylocystis lapponica]|nr:cysteine proteinase [Amylocystis lapponica]
MPAVVVLSPSPALAGFSPSLITMQNGASSSIRDGVISEIKEAAKEQAQKVRGASAISLLKTARHQIALAHTREGEGDLHGALSAFTKAASLAQMFMDSSELKQEGKKGVLVKEFLDFQQHEGHDLKSKMESIEAKLVDVDKATSSTPDTPADEIEAPIRAGGSIADRMRSLQNAGLAVSTTKRISREIVPMSPEAARPNRMSLQSLPSPLPVIATSSPSVASSVASPVAPSPHALVPTSSFGPPSPSSSASSSPRISHLSLSDFTQAFPSIDELDEMEGLKLPSVPTGIVGASSRHSPDVRPIPSKPFPILPMDMGPRPSSTPIPPTIDSFNSRPASPMRSPLSPTVPRKPSGLSLRSTPSRSPIIAPSTPFIEKPDLPSPLTPRTLLEYNNRNNFKVLVLDVRTRQEFEREHIKVDAVVCIEPSVLLRGNVTGESIEDTLLVAPRDEWVLFTNRDKFDLVAVYDEDSETLGDSRSPPSILVRAVFETAFRKFLKHPPMLMVGGLKAWKAEFGEAELERGTSGGSPSNAVNLPTVNGVGSSTVNGIVSPVATYPEAKGIAGGHIRIPAESVMTTPNTSIADQAPVSVRNQPAADSTLDNNAYKPWIPSQPNGRYSLDQSPVSFRSGLDMSPTPDAAKRLARKTAVSRPTSNSISFPYTPQIPENAIAQTMLPPLVNGSSPIQYPIMARHISPQVSGTSFSSSPGLNGLSMPPQASINPSPLSRRRSDYIDQSQEAVSGLTARPSIDYPDLSSQHILRPPPAAASSGMERQDNRPRLMHSHSYTMSQAVPKPPTIQSDYPVTYWGDVQIGTSGLKNLGNTCYMNSTIQCLSATVPFTQFFTNGRWKSAINMVNPIGTKGNLAHAFANILRDMWQGELQCLSPVTFRRSICTYASQFGGTEQHDSQEFLSFLLDGLHEDLNRVLHKPQLDTTPEQEAELEKMPTQIASERQWQLYRMRDDSLVVDFFQGQFRSRLECLTCHKTSTTYNTFMYLSLPIPSGRSATKVTLEQCLDAFVKEEVMEKSDAWNCPHCKALRKATKRLSLSRLPPVLLIHLKRFSVKGHFTDKIETFVDFPLRGLDLTNYMPPPLPPGVSGGSHVSRDDPLSQAPPYRYDLYGVTNHFGTLSSGHYTAFVGSRGSWLYCDDSRVSPADAKDVAGKPAYILFYKRIKA